MDFLLRLLLIAQILSAVIMVGLILMQHGKGAEMGAAFGAGASGSLFGASGSANFLSRATAGMTVVFLSTTLGLAYFGYNVRASEPVSSGSVLERAAITLPAPESDAATAVQQAADEAGVPTDAAAAIPTEPGLTPVPAESESAEPATGPGQIPTE